MFNYLLCCSYDLLILSETWLYSDILDGEFCPESFIAYRRDRDAEALGVARGGGVMICARATLRCAPLDLSIFSTAVPSIDVVGVQIFAGHGRRVYVFAVYVPPSVSADGLREFLDIFSELEYLSEGIVMVLGDFNVPAYGNVNASNRSTLSLENFRQFHNFRQFNTVLNSNGRLLDLLFAAVDCSVARDIDPMVPEDAHHPALSFLIGFNDLFQDHFDGNHAVVTYNFRRADYPLLYSALMETEWAALECAGDVDSRCSMLYQLVYAAFDLAVPKTGVARRSRRQWPSWFSSEVRDAVRMKEAMLLRFRRSRDIFYRDEFVRYRSLSKNLISRACGAYVDSVSASLRADPKSFWNHVRSKRGVTRIPGTMRHGDVEFVSGQSIVDAFANYFSGVYKQSTYTNLPDLGQDKGLSFVINDITLAEVEDALRGVKSACTAGVDQVPGFLLKDCAMVLARPLHGLYNLILKQAKFPTTWKISYICPILKKGDTTNIQNYRPISLLCNFSKVFEAILFRRIYDCVACRLSPAQHGFMRGRSTVTNLATFTQYVAEAVDGRMQVDTVYLDFQKAFDQLDHYILLEKMRWYGFCPPLIRLMKSYLLGREQRVRYRNFISPPFCPTSGVPQGSNLGPLLFLIFIDDVLECVECEGLLFADDLKVFSIVNSPDDCSRLQLSLDRIEDWCRRYRLSLNSEKSFCVTYSRRANALDGQYAIGGVRLRSVDTCVDLGVRFDSRLTFRQHIIELVSKCYKTYGFVYRNARDLSTECMVTLFFALVRSRLEYAAVIWSPTYRVHINSIESVQKLFLKYLCFRLDGVYPPRGSDYCVMLGRFALNSLEERRVVSTTKFAHKILHNGIDCMGLLQSLNFNVPRGNSRLCPTFYDTHSRTNLRLGSPIARICRHCNEIAPYCDLFFDTVRRIVECSLRYCEVSHRSRRPL